MQERKIFLVKGLKSGYMVIAFLLGFCLAPSYANEIMVEETDTEAATVLKISRDISPFELTDSHGKSFTTKRLEGQWTFLFFGFTSCGSICPKILAELNKVHQNLSKQKDLPPHQFVMVSVDPERDSVERMNKYLKAFNRDFIGARGETAQIKAMTKELGIVYMKIISDDTDADDSMDYDIDHSGTILLFNPQGKLQALFSMPHDSDEISKDFVTITHIAQ